MKKILLITMLVFPFLLMAQKDGDDIFDLTLEELMSLEITSVSKRAENVLKAPQTILVITEEQMRQRGYTDLEQLIHDLPGFDISRGNGTQYSQIYQRGYRSRNTERTLFLIDGVEENDIWSNSVWLSRQYPLSNIKRVEVIYGPASTLYGANAFLGVINVITKDGEDMAKNSKIGVNATTGYGSWNTIFADVTTLLKFNENIELSLTGRIYQSDEMDLSHYPDFDYDLSTYDLNFYKGKLGVTDDAIAQAAMDLDNQVYYNDPELGGVKPGYDNSTKDHYLYAKLKVHDFTIGFQTFKRDEGYGAWYRDDYEMSRTNGGKWVPINSSLYLKYDKKINENLSIYSLTSYRVHSVDGASEENYYTGYLNGGLNLSGLTVDGTATGALLPIDQRTTPSFFHAWFFTYSQQLRSEFRVSYHTDKFSLVSGIEARSSFIQGDYWYSMEENPADNGVPYSGFTHGGNYFFSKDLGIYSQGAYQFTDDFKVVLGARVDNNQIRETGGYGTVFNPKAAIVYSPNQFIFKAMYSEAFQDASYWTKYGTTPSRLLNNPTLQPEKVRNGELSATWKVSKQLYFDAGGYYSAYDGAVVTGNATFVNESGTSVTTEQHQAIGTLEIQGAYADFWFKQGNYSAYVNYTFTAPYNTTEDKIRVGDIASHQVNFGGNVFLFDQLNINLRANWVGEKETGANTTISGNPFSSIDPYFVLNGAVKWNAYKGLSVQVLVNNITDLEYFHPGARSANGAYYAARFPQNERNFMLQLNYTF